MMEDNKNAARNTGAMREGRIDRVLRSWGVGQRKEIRKWITQGRITVNGEPMDDPNLQAVQGMEFRLDGRLLEPVPYLTVMMNKPAGYICATKDDLYPTVHSLLKDCEPDRGLFPIGRLDTDTEGLLLLSTDGFLDSFIARPEHEVTKTYRFLCSRPIPPDAAERMAAGITVQNGITFRPAKLKVLGPCEGELTVTEGKYHEVKRLVHACGPRVISLKRIAIGALRLDESLAPGEYRPVTEEELALALTDPDRAETDRLFGHFL